MIHDIWEIFPKHVLKYLSFAVHYLHGCVLTDGKWKHAVSHVPRVYAFGHGNTSSRTPLIILVFGEFGTSVGE